MNQGRTVFAQLISFVSHNEFNRCVARYNGNKSVRSFSCWDQFLTMAFAQLTYRESLRDIEVCLAAQRQKLYHAGFSGPVKRATLADANEKRDWRIYRDFAQSLIQIARPLYAWNWRGRPTPSTPRPSTFASRSSPGLNSDGTKRRSSYTRCWKFTAPSLSLLPLPAAPFTK